MPADLAGIMACGKFSWGLGCEIKIRGAMAHPSLSQNKHLLGNTVMKWVVVISIALAIGLSLPVSNLIISRPVLNIVSKNKAFIQFSRQLQVSCMDCHTDNLSRYPFYFKLPIANQIITKDIEDAQINFDLPVEKLTGQVAFSDHELIQIKGVLTENSMPPLKYTALHWNAVISSRQKNGILAYINQQNPQDSLVALTSKNIPKVNLDKANLGKSLFFDKRLSSNDTISCASCHNLAKGGTDQMPVATGIHGQQGPINSPTVLNSVFNFRQFWDGRAGNLQEQAAGPVTNPKEMGSNWPQVIAKLEKDKLFSRLFQTTYPKGYSSKNITEAIGEYEKTLVTPDSAFDRYLLGDKNAFSAQQEKGYQLFLANKCMSCHSGVALGGQSFDKMGRKADYFAWRNKELTEADYGRFNITKRKSDRHKFKVPTLRNIALTYPYFHDGSTSDLMEAVQIMSEFQNGKKLTPEDARAIADFLKTTTVP
ncbi:MAG: cytochrome c peroxidase [Myxococcaceae bacterium]